VIGPLVAALFMSSWALFVESKPRVSCRCHESQAWSLNLPLAVWRRQRRERAADGLAIAHQVPAGEQAQLTQGAGTALPMTDMI
jgi:hypothetical protein